MQYKVQQDREEQMYLVSVSRDEWYIRSEEYFEEHKEREREIVIKAEMTHSRSVDVQYTWTHTLQSKGRGQNALVNMQFELMTHCKLLSDIEMPW